MWNWSWLDETLSGIKEESSSDVAEESTEESNEHDEDTSSTDTIPAITHSVIYKCIGTLKKHEYQEILAVVKKKMCEGIVVPLKQEKEPHNLVDAKAIASITNVSGIWDMWCKKYLMRYTKPWAMA